jgi:hypothetical protein
MELVEKLEGEFDDVKDLQKAFLSNSMYTYPCLYDMLCREMKTGRLRNQDPRDEHAALPHMLSVAYEAHFRVELRWALSTQGYRHSYSKEAVRGRSRKFKQLLPVVKWDRTEHATEAWSTRQTMLKKRGKYRGKDDSTENPTEHGGVEFTEDEF